MKLSSPIEERKARIEIIPLIDIMFFLLAAFMLVSLSMQQMRGVKVALPTAQTATQEQKSDFFAITLDVAGGLYIEKEKIESDTLRARVAKLVGENKEARFYIRADTATPHGEVMHVLDELKLAGVQRVSFEMRPGSIPTGAPATKTPAEAPAKPTDPTPK